MQTIGYRLSPAWAPMQLENVVRIFVFVIFISCVGLSPPRVASAVEGLEM